MADINIFSLGGQDENGKNITIVEVNNEIFIVNVGNKVPVNNRWGVDAIISDTTYLVENKDRIKGVFLTHAHDENFAALPWLIMDVKGLTIYGSEFTIKAVKERVSKYRLGHNEFKYETIDKKTKIGSIFVDIFEVANSIPGSLAYNFKTPDGDILFVSNYTNADLGPYGKTSIEDIKKNSDKVLALIMDSRRANFHGKSSTKTSITELVEEKFKTAKDDQKIVVIAYDEEMYTLQQIMDLAIKYNRPVALYGRAYDFLYKSLMKAFPNTKVPKFIDYKSISKTSNPVVVVSGTWSRLYQRLVRIAHNKDVFLKFKPSDIVIAIAPPVNGLEVEASQALDEVAKIAPNILDISDKDYYPTRPTQDDTEEFVKIIKPEYFLPISALYRYMYVATSAAVKAGVTRDRNIVLLNGKIAYIKDGKLASQKARVKKYGDVIIDGFGVGDISREVIRERQTLSA
ncbi:MAG: ribonuclease J, partial [Mycoplasmataceae bacterium]|nr:ribonuclease J [Mycoplasmataceae bacterium]